jgi:hypothetical protein
MPFFPVPKQPKSGLRRLVVEVSRSHSDTPHSVGLLWTSCRPLTIHNIHKRQTSMPPVGFEPAIPASALLNAHALDRAANPICRGLPNADEKNVEECLATRLPLFHIFWSTYGARTTRGPPVDGTCRCSEFLNPIQNGLSRRNVSISSYAKMPPVYPFRFYG